MCTTSMPHYVLSDFLVACASKTNIDVWKGVLQDAGNDFNLNTRTEVYDFLAGDQIEDLKFIRTDVIRIEGQSKGLITDSYEFKIGKKYGYFAFLKSLNNEKWFIKSLKFHHKMKFGNLLEDDRVKAALKSAGISKKQIKKRADSHE